jgi:hypothetical protein
MTGRRFPLPWDIEEANSHALAYVYYEQEPGSPRRR